MKIKKLMALAVVCAVTSFIQAKRLRPVVNSVETKILVEKEIIEVEDATDKAKRAIKNAKDKIKAIRKQELLGKLSSEDAAQQIQEQKEAIINAEKELGSVLTSSVNALEQGFLSSFVSRAKKIGEKAVGLAKAGVMYSEEEKRAAQRELRRLNSQKEQLELDYYDLSDGEQELLQERYADIEQRLDNDIYEQQIIAGDIMSTEMKAFWSAIGAGALIAGSYYVMSGTKPEPDGAKLAEKAALVEQEEVARRIAMDKAERKQLAEHEREKAFEKMEKKYKEKQEKALDEAIEEQRQKDEARIFQEAMGEKDAQIKRLKNISQESPGSETEIKPPLPEGQSITKRFDSVPSVPDSIKKSLTPEERELLRKHSLANLLWSVISGGNAAFLLTNFFYPSPVTLWGPGAAFAGAAAYNAAAGINKFIESMPEKNIAEILERKGPLYLR